MQPASKSHFPTLSTSQPTVHTLHSDNLFSAYKTLKQQQDHLTNIKNRIHKLQQNELKTLQKCQNQSKVMLSLQKIRQKKQQQTKKFQLQKLIMSQSTNSQYNKNHQEKQLHKKSIANVFNEIKNKRLSNYEFMKHKRHQNQIKLTKIKELDLEDKKILRNKVVQNQKMMRESKMVKLKARKQNVEKLNQKQIKELEEKSRKQSVEIKQMAKLEIQLLSMHSQSQAKSTKVQEKYESFINSQKQAVKQMRKKDSVESLYVHPLVKRIEKRIDKYNIRNAR